MAHGGADKARDVALSSDSRRGVASKGAPSGEAAPDAPRRFTPTPLGALIPRLARPAFRRMPSGTAQLMTEWEALAGPEAARLATPVAFSRGTLTLACTGPAAMELSMRAPALVERLNVGLGRAAVERLRFVQTPAAPRPPPAAKPVDKPPPLPVSEAIGRVESPELREALARLAAGLYRGDTER
jgi:hypothetical protein